MAENVKCISLFLEKEYQNKFPSIPVLAENDYFVEFNAYEVFLPKTWLEGVATSNTEKEESLNIFEVSVLRLLGIGNFSAVDLSEKLCLPQDLVQFICHRLNESGLLDSNRQITVRGRQKIGQVTTYDEPVQDEISHLLLMSRDNQKVMPMLFSRCEQVGELEKPHINMVVGSTGHAKNVRGRCLLVKERTKHPAMLTQGQIFDALRALACKPGNRQQIRYDRKVHIASTYYAPIFLHAKAVLQNGFIDYAIVSDGGSIHNDFLREYMERQIKGIDTKLKEKAYRLSTKQKKITKYDGRYPEIHVALRQQQKRTETADERRNTERQERQQVQGLAQAIEWALLYHLRKYPPPMELLASLEVQTPEENAQTLLNFAERLGLTAAKMHPKMFSRVYGRLVRGCLQSDNPSLAILLPLSIGTAAKVPDSRIVEALNTLPGTARIPFGDSESTDTANKRENAFSFLNRLDRYGREIRHNDEWHPIESDDVDKLYAAVRQFVQVLLPDYDNQQLMEDDSANASLQRLSAEITVMKALGEDVYRNMPPDLQEQFLKISPDKDDNEEKTGRQVLATKFVETLSIILEKILSSLLHAKPIINMEKSAIIARLQSQGISTDLSTVNDRYYENACRQQKATLGAYTLAYMASLNDTELTKFAEKKIPELAYEIAGYRGHSNNLNMVLDEALLLDLRHRVFEAVKYLGGFINE